MTSDSDKTPLSASTEGTTTSPIPQPSAVPMSSAGVMGFKRWVINHDESWLFIISYVALSVILSVWISLFWLGVVIAVHFGFEWIRQRHVQKDGQPVLPEVLWEVKLDIALILLALALALYMEVVLGVLGLRSAARLGSATRAVLRTNARFAGWQRAIRGILLSVDDAGQLAKAAVNRNRQPREDNPEPEEITVGRWGSWTGRWNKVDWISVALGVCCIGLIVAAPWFTQHDFASAAQTLLSEMHPFPM